MNISDRLVLQLIRSGKATSQSQIARQLRVPGNTIHGLIGRLSRAGLICPDRVERQGRGRPVQHYRINQPGPVLAVRWLGSVWEAGVFAGDAACGRIQQRQSPLVSDLGEAFEALRGMRDVALAQAQVEGTGIAGAVVAINAVQGEAGHPLSSSVLPWLREASDEAFSSALGCEVQLRLAADAVTPELRVRMGEGVRSVAVLNVGDGVSAHGRGLDEVWGGEHVFRGELGHVVVEPRGPMCGCGHRGCLEALISGPAVWRRVKVDVEAGLQTELLPVAGSTPAELFEALERLEEGDRYAAVVVDDFIDRVAWGVSLVANLMGPDVIVLSGYALEGREGWRGRIESRARSMALFGEEDDVRLEFARLGPEEYLGELALSFDFHLHEELDGNSSKES